MAEEHKADLHLIRRNVMWEVWKKQDSMKPSHATSKFTFVFTIHDISQTVSALVLYLFIPAHGSTHFYKFHTLIASTNLAACQA